MSDDHLHPERQRQLQPHRVGQLILRVGERALLPRVCQQRQVQRNHFPVKRLVRLVGGIDELDRRQPLEQQRSVVLGPLQPFERVGAVGVDARPEIQVRVLGRLGGDKLVRDVKLRPRAVELAVGIHRAIHRENDRRAHPLALPDPLGQALHQQLIPLLLRLGHGHPERFQVDFKSKIVPQFLGNKAAAVARANAGHVTVHVEYQPVMRLGQRQIRPGEKHLPQRQQQQHANAQPLGQAHAAAIPSPATLSRFIQFLLCVHQLIQT